jgi:hypothetical protein
MSKFVTMLGKSGWTIVERSSGFFENEKERVPKKPRAI